MQTKKINKKKKDGKHTQLHPTPVWMISDAPLASRFCTHSRRPSRAAQCKAVQWSYMGKEGRERGKGGRGAERGERVTGEGEGPHTFSKASTLAPRSSRICWISW